MPVVSPLCRLGVALAAVLLLGSPAPSAQTTTFESIGGPEGAFLTTVFVADDGDVFVGSNDFYSSAYRSSDDGATWTYEASMPTGSHRSFVQLPDGDLLAASTSDVFRSSDGTTWASTANGYRFRYVLDLAHDGEGRLYASSYYDGVVRSLDGGASWSAASDGLDTLQTSTVATGPSGRVYVAGYGAHVHVSDDHGDSWTPMYDGLPDTHVRALHETDGGRVLAATAAGLFDTSGPGHAWRRVTSGLGIDSTRGFHAFAELPSGRLLAGSYNYVYASDDGGASWSRSTAPGPPSGIYDFATDADGVVYVATYGSGVFRSADGGGSWASSVEGLVGTDVTALGFDAAGRLLVGSRYSPRPRTQRWSPETESWEPLGALPGPIAHSWLRTEAGVLLAGLDGVGVHRSTDDGATWVRSTDVNRFTYALAEASDGDLFAGTFDEGIARSADGGESWTFLGTPLGRTTHLAAAPDGTLYAGITVFGSSDVEPGLIRSTDGGDTWTYINGWSDTPRNPTALAVDADGRLLASFGLPETYRSDDRGDTWAAVEGLPRYTRVLHATGGAVLAAQIDGSLYQTFDGGLSWASVTAEPTGLYPRALAVADDGRIYLGTYGRGVYRSVAAAGTAGEGDHPSRGDLTLRAFPTPFQATTTVEVTLSEAATVRIEVFDAIGRRIARLGETPHPPGTHRLGLDGAGWPAGLYVVRVTAGDRARSVRVIKAE